MSEIKNNFTKIQVEHSAPEHSAPEHSAPEHSDWAPIGPGQSVAYIPYPKGIGVLRSN
jgi:hypothetical protein